MLILLQIERVGRKPLILWCSLIEIISMIIIGGLASGPELSPTVPPPAYGKAAMRVTSLAFLYNAHVVFSGFICIYVFAFNGPSCALHV